MSEAQPFRLPHGARGMEFGDFVLEFREDKIVAIVKGREGHYTLHSGQGSGILDIHRTWRDPAGSEHHQTVFAIRHSDIPLLLNDLAPLMTTLRLLRPLRIGWLYRNRIGIVRGLDPISEQDIAGITRMKAGRKRLIVDEEKVRENVCLPEYLEGVWDFPDGAFSLVAGVRKIGIGMKATDRFGTARLRWFKLRDVRRFSHTAQAQIVATAMRYAIPPEQYSHYRVLKS